MSPDEILTKAADLLEKPGAWTQGSAILDRYGRPTGWSDPRACCFCAFGAIRRASGDPEITKCEALDFADRFAAGLGFSGIIDFNDAPERTQAEVVAKLREAAELAKATGSSHGAGDAA